MEICNDDQLINENLANKNEYTALLIKLCLEPWQSAPVGIFRSRPMIFRRIKEIDSCSQMRRHPWAASVALMVFLSSALTAMPEKSLGQSVDNRRSSPSLHLQDDFGSEKQGMMTDDAGLRATADVVIHSKVSETVTFLGHVLVTDGLRQLNAGKVDINFKDGKIDAQMNSHFYDGEKHYDAWNISIHRMNGIWYIDQ